MIFKMIVSILLLVSCTEQKHRYLIVDKLFSSGKITPEKLELIYEIFGRPEGKFSMKGADFLHRSITKTSDMGYSITLKDGEVLSFLLTPANIQKRHIEIDDILKILPHLNLIKSEHQADPRSHVVKKIFKYRTPDNGFKMRTDVKGRIEHLVWRASNHKIAKSKVVHKQKELKMILKMIMSIFSSVVLY